MANNGSRAPYIIICQGRIDVALAKNGFEMIQSASCCAANLVTYYGDKLTYADTEPISKLQHRMMGSLTGPMGTKPHYGDAGAMVDEMFTLLDALEQKMDS